MHKSQDKNTVVYVLTTLLFYFSVQTFWRFRESDGYRKSLMYTNTFSWLMAETEHFSILCRLADYWSSFYNGKIQSKNRLFLPSYSTNNFTFCQSFSDHGGGSSFILKFRARFFFLSLLVLEPRVVFRFGFGNLYRTCRPVCRYPAKTENRSWYRHPRMKDSTCSE